MALGYQTREKRWRSRVPDAYQTREKRRNRRPAAGIHIGTSGWHYKDWVGPFYPDDTRPKGMLAYYAGEFGVVEINNSFYRLPDTKTLSTWKASTPERFTFAFKASRYITHNKKLRDAGEALDKMVGVVSALGDKLGPILFQLPPRWKVNSQRLDGFLGMMPPGLRVAFEFRDPSWFNDEVYGILRSHGAAFCIYELDGRKSPTEVTGDLVYIRLHGPDGAYKGSYSTRDLSGWAGAISSWTRSGKDVYCFFDNDERGYAAQNALELKRMLE